MRRNLRIHYKSPSQTFATESTSTCCRRTDACRGFQAPTCHKTLRAHGSQPFGGKIRHSSGRCSSQVICFVSENCCGEKRIVSVSSDDSSQSSAELLVTLEPLLAPYEDFVNHPAFCRLGMHSKQLGDALIIPPSARGGRSAIFLCVAAPIWRFFTPGETWCRGGRIAQAARECLPSPLDGCAIRSYAPSCP